MPWCDTLCVWFDLCTISDLAAHTTILPPGPMFCFGYVPSLQHPPLIWLSHTYVLSLISRCVSVLNVLHLWLKSFSSCSLTHELIHDLHDHTPWALLNNWGWSEEGRAERDREGCALISLTPLLDYAFILAFHPDGGFVPPAKATSFHRCSSQVTLQTNLLISSHSWLSMGTLLPLWVPWILPTSL